MTGLARGWAGGTTEVHRGYSRVGVQAAAQNGWHGADRRCFKLGPLQPATRRAGGPVRLCGCVIGLSRASASGVTWTSRTTSAEWAVRNQHTSVIDAAGAIYVIGGFDPTTGYLNDVWQSPDGGA